MIQIDVKKAENGDIICFHVCGHSGFSEIGTDVVCAGVSALIINCINSVEKFSDTRFDLIQKDGNMEFTCKPPLDDRAVALLQSLFFGVQEIQKKYGNEYVTLQ